MSLQVRGDVKIVFWDWDAMPGSDDKMFWLHFNTAFVHEMEQVLLLPPVLNVPCMGRHLDMPCVCFELQACRINCEWERTAPVGGAVTDALFDT